MTTTAASSTVDTGCGCPDVASGLSRRGVLKGLGIAAVAGAGLTVSPGGARYAFAAGTTTETLIVLSMRGGFDGLSAIAPVGDPGYLAARGSSAVPASTALKLDETFGFHPSLAPLLPLWSAGRLAAVVDVGQSSGTRSHFEAMGEMERAAPGSSVRTGWLDRLIGLAPSDGLFTASQLGSSAAPQSFIGPNVEMTVNRLDDFRLAGASTPEEVTRWAGTLRAMHAGGHASISAPVTRAMDALSSITTVKAGYPSPYTLPAAYPRTSWGEPTPLARSLDDTARLMKAGVGLRVVTIDCDNWDMHEGAGVNGGWMSNQLGDLAKALAAFAAELGPLLESTTILTLSEFGRRVRVNGTGGFDHGHGNQMLVLGGGVNGGRVHGTWSGLADSVLVQGDLPGRTDYRGVLGSILTRRMGLTSAQLSTVFPNPPSTLLDVARAL